MTHTEDAAVQDEFQRTLRDGLLRTQFQPIVNVRSRTIVGYEALVRGPAGSIVESPNTLIAEAYRQNRVVEFDWKARATASRAALASGLSAEELLLLNIEPLALASSCPVDLWSTIEEAFERFRVVLEVTERSLDHDPKTLLEGIDRQRPTVSGLALDDVGADVRTLSLLPTVEPDIIKLDLQVTQGSPGPQAMRVLDFVYEECERTRATALAEGVETERHHEVVRELGASLAQGWLYGKPSDPPLPGGNEYQHEWLGHSVAIEDVHTPFEVLGGNTISHASTELVHSLAQEIFANEIHLQQPAMCIVLVPRPGLLTQQIRELLSESARRGVVTGALGRGLPGDPAPGVRGAWEHDPSLDREWAGIALSPSTGAAMLARELPGTQSRFEFGVTHDRHRVISAARCLLRRLGPQTDVEST